MSAWRGQSTRFDGVSVLVAIGLAGALSFELPPSLVTVGVAATLVCLARVTLASRRRSVVPVRRTGPTRRDVAAGWWRMGLTLTGIHCALVVAVIAVPIAGDPLAAPGILVLAQLGTLVGWSSWGLLEWTHGARDFLAPWIAGALAFGAIIASTACLFGAIAGSC